jgi:hypothetical protein
VCIQANEVRPHAAVPLEKERACTADSVGPEQGVHPMPNSHGAVLGAAARPWRAGDVARYPAPAAGGTAKRKITAPAFT